MNEIVIVIRGGLVQNVYTNGNQRNYDIQIFDIDNELESNGKSFIDKIEKKIDKTFTRLLFRSLSGLKDDPIHQQAIEDIQHLKDNNLEG